MGAFDRPRNNITSWGKRIARRTSTNNPQLPQPPASSSCRYARRIVRVRQLRKDADLMALSALLVEGADVPPWWVASLTVKYNILSLFHVS